MADTGFKQRIRRYIFLSRGQKSRKDVAQEHSAPIEKKLKTHLEDSVQSLQCLSLGPSQPIPAITSNPSPSIPCEQLSSGFSPKHNKPASSFLDFPSEVRLAIYKYLIPTQDPWNFYKSRSATSEVPSLRHDNVPCSPKLLSTCKKVYGELVEEFYSHAQFPTLIHSSGISFFTNKYQNTLASPIAWQIIQDLKITLAFHGEEEDELATSAENREMTTLLRALVATTSSLKRLELQLTLPEKFLSKFHGELDVVPFGSVVVRYFRLLARTVRATSEFRKTTAVATHFTFREPSWGPAAPWHLNWLLYAARGFVTAWINRTACEPLLKWETLLGDVKDEEHMAWGRCGYAHAWEVEWL